MSDDPSSFRDRFGVLFDGHFQRLYRFLDRATGDPALAADLAQEAFVKLYRRGSFPDAPEAWLLTVAMNLLRNARKKRARRRRLLSVDRARWSQGDPSPSPDRRVDAAETRARVRGALDALPQRERDLLLLRAEGYSYRDLARALDLNEGSVGTLLARARARFQEAYDPPR